MGECGSAVQLSNQAARRPNSLGRTTQLAVRGRRAGDADVHRTESERLADRAYGEVRFSERRAAKEIVSFRLAG